MVDKCFNNKMEPFKVNGKQSLNNNVFNYEAVYGACLNYSNEFKNNCGRNTFPGFVCSSVFAPNHIENQFGTNNIWYIDDYAFVYSPYIFQTIFLEPGTDYTPTYADWFREEKDTDYYGLYRCGNNGGGFTPAT